MNNSRKYIPITPINEPIAYRTGRWLDWFLKGENTWPRNPDGTSAYGEEIQKDLMANNELKIIKKLPLSEINQKIKSIPPNVKKDIMNNLLHLDPSVIANYKNLEIKQRMLALFNVHYKDKA